MVIDMSERDNVYIITIATREEFAAKKCSLVAIYYNKEYADKMFDKLKMAMQFCRPFLMLVFYN